MEEEKKETKGRKRKKRKEDKGENGGTQRRQTNREEVSRKAERGKTLISLLPGHVKSLMTEPNLEKRERSSWIWPRIMDFRELEV